VSCVSQVTETRLPLPKYPHVLQKVSLIHAAMFCFVSSSHILWILPTRLARVLPRMMGLFIPGTKDMWQIQFSFFLHLCEELSFMNMSCCDKNKIITCLIHIMPGRKKGGEPSIDATTTSISFSYKHNQRMTITCWFSSLIASEIHHHTKFSNYYKYYKYPSNCVFLSCFLVDFYYRKAIQGEIKISTENGETRTLRCAPDWGVSTHSFNPVWLCCHKNEMWSDLLRSISDAVMSFSSFFRITGDSNQWGSPVGSYKYFRRSLLCWWCRVFSE
jgi:hypothetical protein